MPPAPLTKLLLRTLAATGQRVVDFYVMLHDLKYNRGWYRQGGHANVREEQWLRDERRAKLALVRLRRSNYVIARKIGQRLVIELTDKGRQALLSQTLRSAPKAHDGSLTVVVFDVPESQRLARQQLRLMLKQGGFVKLQQSVWVSERDCYGLVSDFVKRIKAARWVNVFRGYDFLHLPEKQ